jgi:glycosyltransferase involved in cell wall biosynthesis
MPRVSITIPTYNCAHFIERAIRSILAQSYTDYEIVIVDDGSTDNTRVVLAPFGDRIRYIYQANGGLSAARNTALAHAGGELIAYLDADDLWYPDRLERQVAFLDANPGCGFVHSDVTVIDEHDRIIHQRFNAETGRPVPQGPCVLDLLRRCHVQVPSVLERRICVERAGSFHPRLKTAQDYLHWIRIAMSGMAVGYIAEPLALYRRTTSSLSSSPRRVLDDYVMIFEDLLADRISLRRHGAAAIGIAEQRLYAAQRELAYLDRLEGRVSESLRRTMRLVRQSPTAAALYLDVLKTCAGFVLRGGAERAEFRRIGQA